MKKEVYSLRKFGKLLAPAVLGAALLMAAPASADEVSPAEAPAAEGLVTAVNAPVAQGEGDLSQVVAENQPASELVKEWGQPTIENGKLLEGEWEIPADAKPLNLVEDAAQGSTGAEKNAQAVLAQAKSDIQAQEEKLAASEKKLVDSKNKVVELEKAVQKQEERVDKIQVEGQALDWEAIKKGDFSSVAGEWKHTANSLFQRPNKEPKEEPISDGKSLFIQADGSVHRDDNNPVTLHYRKDGVIEEKSGIPLGDGHYTFPDYNSFVYANEGTTFANLVYSRVNVAGNPALASESARLVELRAALAEAQEDLALNMAQVEEAQAALAVSRQNLRIAEKQVEIASQGRVVADIEAELAAQKEELAALKDKYVTVIDFEAIAQGDFSSLAGEWTTEEGASFTFSKEGMVKFGPFEVQASFDAEALRLTLPLPKGGDVYHPSYLLFTASNDALIFSDNLGEKLYVRKAVLDNAEAFERIQALEISIALLEESLDASLEVLDNLEDELIELEAGKEELVADSKKAKEAVAAKNLNSVPAAKVVGLASNTK